MPHPFRLRKDLFAPRIKQFFVRAKLQYGYDSQIRQHHFQTFLHQFEKRKPCALARHLNTVFSQVAVQSVRDFAQRARRQQSNHRPRPRIFFEKPFESGNQPQNHGVDEQSAHRRQ